MRAVDQKPGYNLEWPKFAGQGSSCCRDYLENESLCRRQLLLQYFDPSLVSTLNDLLICCDVCAERSVTQVKFGPDITSVCKYVHTIAERLSVRHIIVRARRALMGYKSEVMLVCMHVCLSVTGLRLKYTSLRMVYVPSGTCPSWCA